MEIKNKPEDFIVEEIIDLECTGGNYGYYKVVKKDRNTLDVVADIARCAGVKRKDVGFAGSKDRRAVTTQYVSVKGFKGELRVRNADISFIGSGAKPISLGDLKGNKFKIKLDQEINFKVNFCVNYFGKQRFGKNNIEIGKAIVKKEFEKACLLAEAEVEKKDFIGALRRFDKKLLRLFVHAYQSYLWNLYARKYIDENYKNVNGFVLKKEENVSIPLTSFDMESDEIYDSIFADEGVCKEDFLIREMPELVSCCVYRELFVNVSDFVPDGYWVSFFLPSGSYATVVIEFLETLINMK